MNRHDAAPETISDELIAEVCARFAGDRRVRRTLPGGGRLNIDRRLPFLCLYRQPPDRPDGGTRHLISGEASYLIAPGEAAHYGQLVSLVRALAETGVEQFGAFLLLEVWAGPDSEAVHDVHPRTGEPLPLRPGFRIRARLPDPPERTITRLSNALQRLTVARRSADVETDPETPGHPDELPALLTADEIASGRFHVLGLQVRPIYRDAETGAVYPDTLRVLRRGLGKALKQAFFTFARTRTTARPHHYQALGGRTLVKAVWEADRQLAEVADAFDFLLQVTPVNSETAWYQFKRSGFQGEPEFEYRPLAFDPALMKRRLYDAPLEDIEDPTVAHLFRQKQDELDRKITMLGDIGTPRFLPGSLQVYGGIGPELLALATELLERIPSRTGDESHGRPLNAEEFADSALAEIEHYRSRYAAFSAEVVIRDDIVSGLMVSGGHLLIGRDTEVPPARAEALLQHEVGTHCLTYHNACAQPLKQLHAGLAGYDGLQEGLAVLAEYLVGGLNRPRLRLLAARVVAIDRMTQGASFTETFRLLREEFDFPSRTAFTVAARIYRGGGLTKDAVYLRGLVEILEYLHNGGELEPLFVGKLAVDHIPMIQELLHRQVLQPPPLRPRYMENPSAHDRLSRLAQGMTVMDLVEHS